MALRLGAQEDSGPIARASWAARRLTGGPDPKVEAYSDMAAFLGRHGAASVLMVKAFEVSIVCFQIAASLLGLPTFSSRQ